jgi:GAF domain-containing protein
MSTDHVVSDIDFKCLSEKVFSLFTSDHPQKLLITDIIILIQVETGIEAVGLRLHNGLDYPYYYTRGFPYDFIEKEKYLCAIDSQGEVIWDQNGEPCLECMCGNVIRGRTNPALPFFTTGGSFWTNCTTDLLAGTTESDRQSKTRNRCNQAGYESVALIPLKNEGNIYGLIQLNDHRKSVFTEEFICFMEEIAKSVALLFSITKQEECLKKQNESFLN